MKLKNIKQALNYIKISHNRIHTWYTKYCIYIKWLLAVWHPVSLKILENCVSLNYGKLNFITLKCKMALSST